MLYYFSSNNFALKGKRKTISANDVLSALEDMEFDQFVDPLKECLAGKLNVFRARLFKTKDVVS